MISEDLTSEQAAEFLGVRSLHTIRHWLEGGSFPGSYQDNSGNWRFSVTRLEEVREHMEAYQERTHMSVDLVVIEN